MSRRFNVTQPLGRLMYEQGFSVEQFSGLTGCSYRTISDYLAGRAHIRPHHLTEFSEALGVPVSELLAPSSSTTTNDGSATTGATGDPPNHPTTRSSLHPSLPARRPIYG